MKKISVLTIILAFFWSIIIVLATLSPFAQSGGTPNQFGDKNSVINYNWNIYFR